MGLFKFTADSFQNFAARVGLGAGNQHDQSTYGFNFTSRDRLKLEAMYRSSWVVGQVVDVVAEDMTREGITLRGMNSPEDVEEINQELDRLEIWDNLSDTIKWSRLYGGAIAVMLIDGQNVSTPLNINTVGKDQFKGLLVLDRWMVLPDLQDLVTEYGPEYGKPKYYDVITDSVGLCNQSIHYSRVIRMDGVNLPYWQAISENLWGQSVIERLEDRLTIFDSATLGAGQLVYKAHLRTYKVKGLRKIIAMGGIAYSALVKQIQQIRMWQSNEGMTLMDDEDTFETHQYSFTGLDGLLLQFGQQIAGATQIPLVRLFGQSPVGLNATGESDLSNYYDNINQQQERRLRTPLHTLLAVVSLSALGKSLPKTFKFDFASLWQMDDEKKAEIANKVADAVTKVEDSGLISRKTALKELRQSAEVTSIFSHITDEEIDQADDDPPSPRSETMDAEWNESDHPRDENGQFGNGSSQKMPLKGELDIKSLVDMTLNHPTTGNQVYAEISEVDPLVADTVKSVTGIDVSGYKHGIDEAAIRHILKQHGNNESEGARGQVAITKEDIESLDHVLNKPDSVEYAGASSDGTPTIIMKKRQGDMTVCVQEVRTGRKRLAVKTMWKVRSVRTPEG